MNVSVVMNMNVSHYDGHPVIVKSRRFKHRSWRLNPAGEEEEGQNTWGDTRQMRDLTETITKQYVWCHNNLTNSTDDQKFPKKQQKISDFIQHHDPEDTRHTCEKTETCFFRMEIWLSLMYCTEMTRNSPHNIPHEQTESVFSWNTEVFPVYGDLESRKDEFIIYCMSSYCLVFQTDRQTDRGFVYHDVSVSVDELDEFLQTPETAFETTHDEACTRVLSGYTHTQLLISIGFMRVVMCIHCSSELLHLNLWSRYSRMILTICTSVRMRAPNASEPTWYLMRWWQISNMNNQPQINS